MKKPEVRPAEIVPGQCRAARALLGWSQDDLSNKAGIAKKTLQLFELDQRKPYPVTMGKIVGVLAKAGVDFIAENGGGHGARLKKRGRT